MTRPAPKIVDRIYSEALELSGDERGAYIKAECGNDEALKKRVVELVAAAEASADGFDGRFSLIRDRLLEEVLGGDPVGSQESEDLSGSRINNWRLEKQLARGGLATVYIAHRDDGEYDQRAAFKVLRRGLDTDDVVARFRAERQILSALDHPAIAGILDGGALEDGRPYLVLEFVDGKSITEYSSDNDLSVRQRVALFLNVLRALHHAHRHLIVHRDIKPSNIMVSNAGHVSLLDFGIAKLLDPGAVPGASALTRTGISLLTPGYCSPEQHAGDPVTTASDIYQAGAVLYELLTGKRPRAAGEKDDFTASSAPSQSLQGSADLADVRGDLDAIVFRAMHPDPLQRYASAEEMAADLERYLDGLPVIAGPDTLRYRLVKFAKRRPLVLPAALAALIAIGGYIATLNAYNEQLRIEQRRASAAQTFMVDLLRSPDPFRPADPDLGRNITVVDALQLGVERLKTDLQDDPQLRASLLTAIASVYASLDQHREAIDLGEEALSLQQAVFGERSTEVLDSLELLARQHRALSEYEPAKNYFDRQLDMALELYPADHPRVGAAQAESAAIASAVGDLEAAERLYREGIQRMRTAPEEYSRPLINALVGLTYLRSSEDFDEAMALLSEAEAVAGGERDPDNLSMALIHAQAATSYSFSHDYARAEERFRQALAIYEKHIGRDHGATLSTLNNLGIMYMRAGDFAGAETVLREVLERYLNKYDGMNRMIATSYQNLATAISRQNRYAESMPLHRKAFEIYSEILPDDHFEPALPLLTLSYAELQLQRFADAEASAAKASTMLEKTAPDTYIFGVAQCLLGLAMQGQGRNQAGQALLDEAEPLILESDVSGVYRDACIDRMP